MNQPEYAVCHETDAAEIKRLREALGLTQEKLAELLGCSRPTVERWERSPGAVKGPIAVLVHMLLDHPEYMASRRIPEKTYPLRLMYMYRQQLCTIIDVDESRRQVQIWNYTDHFLFRAFGVNEHPTYAEYEDFLESRCFPRERDKMKLVLRDLGIPFYDPFLIIEKTQGRMAEDNFWIRIVR